MTKPDYNDAQELTNEKRPMTASEQRRWARLNAALRRHRRAADALIEVLHVAQKLFGHLPTDVLRHVARELNLPPSRVLGVASFYHLFRLAPPRAHRCLVCLGTTCYIRGAPGVLSAARAAARSNPNLDVGMARCLGTCGMAPLIVVDDRVIGPVTSDELRSRLEDLAPHEPRGTRSNR